MSRFVVKGKKGLPDYQIKSARLDTEDFNFSVSSPIIAGPTIAYKETVNDVINVTVDSVTYTFDKVLNDPLNAVDVIDLDIIFFREFSDIADVTDTVALLTGLVYSDSISGVTDSSFLAFGKNVNEDLNTVDTQTLDVDKPISENLTTDEDTTLELIKVLFDAANVADLVGVPDGLTYNFGKGASDNTTVSDIFERVFDAVRNFDDVNSVTEQLVLDYSKIINETVSTSDVEDVRYEMGKVLNDDVTSSDILTRILTVIRNFDEALNANEQIALHTSKPFDDIFIASDVLLRELGRPVFDTFNVNDDSFYDLEKEMTHIATTSDDVDFDLGKPLDDTLTIIDSGLDWSFTKIVSELVDIDEDLIYSLSKPFEDTSTISDVAIPVYTGFRAFTDSNTMSDDLIYQMGKVLNETVPVTESLQYTYSTSYDDTFSVAEVHTIHLSRPLADSVTLNDDFIDIKQFKQLYSTGTTSTSEITFDLQQTLGDTATATDLVGVPDGLTFSWATTFADSTSNSDVATIAVGGVLEDSITATEGGSLIERSYFAADFVEFDDQDFSTAYDFVTTQTF